MGKVKISKKLEKPSEHAAVKLIPSFCFKVVSLVIQYSLKYIILLLTFFGEFRRLYAVSTRRFSGGLSYDYLQKDMGNLSKLPRHMTFVINEDVPTDYSDIANLIIWTIAMGIPYITLYDPHGELAINVCCNLWKGDLFKVRSNLLMPFLLNLLSGL